MSDKPKRRDEHYTFPDEVDDELMEETNRLLAAAINGELAIVYDEERPGMCYLMMVSGEVSIRHPVDRHAAVTIAMQLLKAVGIEAMAVTPGGSLTPDGEIEKGV